MIRFAALGEPRPKGSKRAFVRGGKAMLVEETREGLATWRQRLSLAVAEVAPEDGPAPEPVAVLATFRLAPPKKRRWPWPIPRNRGDLDKLSRSLLDELSSVLIVDDAQVVFLAAGKVFSEKPGADVVVMDLMALADPDHWQRTADGLVHELRAMVVELAMRGGGLANKGEVRTKEEGRVPGRELDGDGNRAGDPAFPWPHV